MSAEIMSSCAHPHSSFGLTSSCGLQFDISALSRLISSGALHALLIIWKQKFAVVASSLMIERTAAGSAMVAAGVVMVDGWSGEKRRREVGQTTKFIA